MEHILKIIFGTDEELSKAVRLVIRVILCVLLSMSIYNQLGGVIEIDNIDILTIIQFITSFQVLIPITMVTLTWIATNQIFPGLVLFMIEILWNLLTRPSVEKALKYIIDGTIIAQNISKEYLTLYKKVYGVVIDWNKYKTMKNSVIQHDFYKKGIEYSYLLSIRIQFTVLLNNEIRKLSPFNGELGKIILNISVSLIFAGIIYTFLYYTVSKSPSLFKKIIYIIEKKTNQKA